MPKKREMAWLLIGLLLQILCGYGNGQWNGSEKMFYNLNFNNNNNLNANSVNVSASEAGMWRQARRGSLADACTLDDGTSGTCMSRFNCMRQGGLVRGYCGVYGVCCETSMKCGDVTRLKRIILKNPAQFLNSQCQYSIEPYSSSVCQLLIEFQRFELRQPELNAAGELECIDYLQVGDYTLCGDNSMQHLYLPFNAQAGVSVMSLLFNLPSMLTQTTWHLVITQLECPVEKKRIGNGMLPWSTGPKNLQDLRTIFSSHNSDLDLLAPPGCDQYYRLPTGHIKSFNYRDGATNYYYLPNMKYTICIKHVPGASMIEYTVNKFSLSAEVHGIPGSYYDDYCHPNVYLDVRKNDFLMIPQAFFLNEPLRQPTYFCGTGLEAGQVLIAAAPYIMYFSSDDKWDMTETGFSISYRVKTVL